MNLRLVPTLVFLTLSWGLHAQTTGQLVVKVTPRIVEQDQSVSWEQPVSQVTSPGVPVVVKIDAEPFKIRITITPFLRDGDVLLVVQGNVIQVSPAGVSKSTTLQSMHAPPGEDIAYFPLGRAPDGARQMVVLLRVEQQNE